MLVGKVMEVWDESPLGYVFARYKIATSRLSECLVTAGKRMLLQHSHILVVILTGVQPWYHFCSWKVKRLARSNTEKIMEPCSTNLCGMAAILS